MKREKQVCDVANMGIVCGVVRRRRRDTGEEEEVEAAHLG